jgi:hypothetical protein
MSDTGDGRRSERDAASAEEERRRQALLAGALGSHNLPPPRDVPPPGEVPPAHPALDRILRLTSKGLDLATYALWIVVALAIGLVYWLS